MTCTHETRQRENVFQFTDWDGNDVYEREEVVTSLYRDIDLHRVKCSRCGHIAYYSGAARAFYEEGVRSDIPGLGGRS